MARIDLGGACSAYSTHSVKRTKVTQIYKKTSNLRALQLQLGHTKMDTTVRQLDLELKDSLSITEATEVLSKWTAQTFCKITDCNPKI